ncbi:MAG: response regulator [candidate division Zixibacteria bacterium]|nr:response regulator [candidate division Zixibacteria bacterium]
MSLPGSVSVLVVDDEELMRQLLKKILEREGYTVQEADSVAEAKDLLSGNDFDVIVSDIKMPDEDGFSLLKYVKENYPDIGVALITGHGDTYSVKDAMLLGADEYVAKPFKSYEIALVVERMYWRSVSKARMEKSGA